ncbi:hypothetical protein GRFL_3006 [Christiangramia flava JLT2011]|uniref:Uncharacterized protein n=1 Tax=Christiangramia flava JLT2011 TaxID=1229726 RepID=A0A1L7I813_9FLAO|nr:hypothetical protein GRFL_3006 [Christiangramia flava JLT2011]
MQIVQNTQRAIVARVIKAKTRKKRIAMEPVEVFPAIAHQPQFYQ